MAKNPLLWKFMLILVVIVVAAFFSYPPQERISLGLDLRGGAHLLLQVDTAGAVRYQLDRTVDRLGQVLKNANLPYASILPVGPGTMELRGTDPARRDDVAKILNEQVAEWQIDNLGSGNWRLTMPAELRTYHEAAATDSALNVIRKRIDALGIAETLVQKEGIKGDRILVQVPGVEDPGRLKDIMQGGALLEWKAVTYPPGVDPTSWNPPDSREALLSQFGGRIPDDTEIYEQRLADIGGAPKTVYWPLKRVSTVSGADLRNAQRSSDEWGEPSVSFELTQEAGQRFEQATQENLHRRMAILLDGQVISAPEIQGVIRDQGIIKGGFDITRAEDLALQLRSGAIPAKVTVIEERTVGPSLGRDSIRAGVTSGLAGFLAVLLFMVGYYRLSGINAIVALALNVLLISGTLGALPFLFSGSSGLRASLTLPGIAGMVLTVGMAVDSNVLVFERIREELRLGKTIRSSVEQGFTKAFLTILDCHVTTVTSAIFLSLYGTGPVRGFAVTLIIGLVASMFTSVFVSRQLFELVLLYRPRAQSLSI